MGGDEANVGAGQLAPLGRRVAALAYEVLLLAALLLIAGFLLAPVVSPPRTAIASTQLPLPPLPWRIVSFAVLFALAAVFFAWSWSEGRRTLPMKTWRLALVTATGEPLPMRTALARYLAAWVGPAFAVVAYGLLPAGFGALSLPLLALNWIAAVVDPERQFLHDRLAGTRLVTT